LHNWWGKHATQPSCITSSYRLRLRLLDSHMTSICCSLHPCITCSSQMLPPEGNCKILPHHCNHQVCMYPCTHTHMHIHTYTYTKNCMILPHRVCHSIYTWIHVLVLVSREQISLAYMHACLYITSTKCYERYEHIGKCTTCA
jgi:hypothetical protein